MSLAAQDLTSLENDPRLFLYTSLTAGSSHIITATSRLETILKANRIPFQAIDVATDEKARRLWGRRAGKRKLPGLVKEGYVVGDLEEIEEWNEYGELKENIGPVPPAAGTGATPAPPLPVKTTATAASSHVSPAPAVTATTASKPASSSKENAAPIALPGAAEIKARNNPLPQSSPERTSSKAETMSSAPAAKAQGITAAKAVGDEPKYEHLSAPASALQSGTATPAEPATAASKEDEKVSKEDDKSEGEAGVEKGAEEEKETKPLAASEAAAAAASVPAEALVSDALPEGKEEATIETAPEKGAEKEEVESKKVEEQGGEEEKSASKGIEGLQVGEGKTVNQQNAAEGKDAGKSVED